MFVGGRGVGCGYTVIVVQLCVFNSDNNHFMINIHVGEFAVRW